MGDLDRDGDLDVVSNGGEGDESPLTVLLNDGMGVFSLAPASDFVCPSGRIALGDFNDDGAVENGLHYFIPVVFSYFGQKTQTAEVDSQDRDVVTACLGCDMQQGAVTAEDNQNIKIRGDPVYYCFNRFPCKPLGQLFPYFLWFWRVFLDDDAGLFDIHN